MATRLANLFVALFAMALLSACGPSEADQRKAFIAFLQERIIARPGVHVPQPNADTLKTFGDYAGHYGVITRFHERMNASVAKPMQEALARGVPRSIEDVVKRKTEITAIRAGFGTMRTALDTTVATADAERAALKQPDDLAVVYNAAYARVVTEPVSVFREVFPITDESFGTILALADLIEANRGAITLSGSQIQVTNPAVQTKLQAALSAMNAKQQAMSAAQQKLRRSITGS